MPNPTFEAALAAIQRDIFLTAGREGSFPGGRRKLGRRARVKSQGGNGTAERVSVHAQFSRRLALIAVVFPQQRSEERLPELPHGFDIENPALVHLAYKCVQFTSHGSRSLKRDEGMMARKLRSSGGAVNYLNAVQWELGGVFHNCTRAGH